MKDNLFDDTVDPSQEQLNDGDSAAYDGRQPLATAMRPRSLDDFVGQQHIIGQGKLLRHLIECDRIQSLVFFGPPGTGKTSLAVIISVLTKAYYRQVNAVTSSVSDLKKIIEEATQHKKINPRKRFILFVDEIHRFNTAQQDVLMPYVESGLITLIGATTHNPFFSVNGPLLSRSMIFELKPLEEPDIQLLLRRGLAFLRENHKELAVEADDESISVLARAVAGDGRRALNTLEIAAWFAASGTGDRCITVTHIEAALQKRVVRYDKKGDQHYDVISAFIKSLRGSDPDAAVYWLAFMLYSGEDPRFITRRMLIFASEDIGNADPHAIMLASACMQAVEYVGLPEARIILSQCVTYLATAPKSNAAYRAISDAEGDVRNASIIEVPDHLRGTGYQGAEKLGRGEGYKYPHDFEGHVVDQTYGVSGKRYYEPSENGYERQIKAYMKVVADLKEKQK